MVTPRFVDEDVREAEIWKDSSHSLMLSTVPLTSTVASTDPALNTAVELSIVMSPPEG